MEKKYKSCFENGEKNEAYAQYFVGQSYLKMLSTKQVVIANVTFEPGCRNDWHIHQSIKGGGQILLITGGEGWYQEWRKSPIKLKQGDVVNIEPGVKHWHGATKNSWFSHIAVEVPGEKGHTQWLERVKDEDYDKLD